MSAALKMDRVDLEPGHIPASEARAFVVAEYRRLANELESGKLRGARIEWREESAAVVVVECDPWCKYCDANIEHVCKREVRFITTKVDHGA